MQYLAHQECGRAQELKWELAELFEQAHVRLVPRPVEVTRFDAPLHFAVRLMHVRAVRESARFRSFGQLRKVVAQRVAVEIPKPELANPRRIDQVRSAAEVVQCRPGRG